MVGVGKQIENHEVVEFITRLGEQPRVARTCGGIATDEHDHGCLRGDERRHARSPEARTGGVDDDETGGLRLPIFEERFHDGCAMIDEVVPRICHGERIRFDESDRNVCGDDGRREQPHSP